MGLCSSKEDIVTSNNNINSINLDEIIYIEYRNRPDSKDIEKTIADILEIDNNKKYISIKVSVKLPNISHCNKGIDITFKCMKKFMGNFVVINIKHNNKNLPIKDGQLFKLISDSNKKILISEDCII